MAAREPTTGLRARKRGLCRRWPARENRNRRARQVSGERRPVSHHVLGWPARGLISISGVTLQVLLITASTTRSGKLSRQAPAGSSPPLRTRCWAAACVATQQRPLASGLTRRVIPDSGSNPVFRRLSRIPEPAPESHRRFRPESARCHSLSAVAGGTDRSMSGPLPADAGLREGPRPDSGQDVPARSARSRQ